MFIVMGIIVVIYLLQVYLFIIEKFMWYLGEFNVIMDFIYILVIIIKFNYGILVFFCFREYIEQIMIFSVLYGVFCIIFFFVVIVIVFLFYVVFMFMLYDIFEYQFNIFLFVEFKDEFF